jgi:hypothetical protein
MGAVFLAEISKRLKEKPLFTPADEISRNYNIYKLYIGARPQTYWTDWGGWYDNPETEMVEIRFVEWLFPVSSMADLLETENSCYTGGGYLYVNVPLYTRFYRGSDVTCAVRQGFLSGPLSAEKPSGLFLSDAFAEARFSPPSVGVKLADVISGITMFGTFNITLDNSDGMFDGADAVELFNTPAYILKTTAENAGYGDFHRIRTGMVESVKIDSEKITITAADKFRSLDSAVCRLVTASEFPLEKEDAAGKPLPAAFGNVTMPLIEIGGGKYLVAEHITGFDGLYDENGASLPYTRDGLVITYSGTGRPKYARFTGHAANRLGEIITALVERAALKYIPSVWDTVETDRYNAAAPRLNIAFTGGDVKAAIQTALKSDTAYLIQKNDGLFTIRKWGADYALHEIPEWLITGKPEKDFSSAEKNYFSSCVVRGRYNEYAKTYGGTYAYDGMEEAAIEKYLKNKRAEYDTRLADTQRIRELAEALAARFCVMRDTVRVSVGADTSRYNLLDKVRMTMSVNGRKYSNNGVWVIKETDPANDRLVLEAV